MNDITKAPETHIRTSELLLQLAEDKSAPDISFGEIIKKLGDRAFGPILLVFSLPMVFPMPPGVSTLFGLPLLILTFQMIKGSDTLWLPKFLTERRFSHKVFAAVAGKMAAVMRPLEHLLKPRCNFMIDSKFEKITAMLMFTMALIMFLPVPGFNMLPAVAIVITAIGYIERDGLVVMLGNLVAIATLYLMWLSSHLIIKALHKMWEWLSVPLNWGD